MWLKLNPKRMALLMLQISTLNKSQKLNVKSQKLMKNRTLEWAEAKDVKKELKKIIKALDFSHIKSSRVFCYRTEGSKAKAYARTWMMPKIFQDALGIEPAYVIEVLSKYYDRLNEDQKSEVLIHELLHIPKNFSGALLSHRGRTRHIGHDANSLFKKYKNSK